MTRGFLAGLAVVVALGAAEPGVADQNDPRLDDLFARLDEVESREKGFALSRKIWSIWYEHGNPAVERVMRQGHRALRVGEPGVALALFDRAARLAPDYAEAWNARATVLYHLGNYAKSLDDIARTLELEPRHFGALSGRGLCYSALDKPEKALTAFEASLSLNPHQPGTRQRVRELRDEIEGREI